MEKHKRKEASHSIHMDRPMIVRIISILICVAMIVGIPAAAGSDRVKLVQHPHEMSEVIVIKEASCENAGTARKECRFEGCTYTEAVEMLALEHQMEGLVCGRCETEFPPEFQDVDGVLYVYANGQPVEDYTGFVTYEGEQWYAKDGVRNTEYKGLYHTDEVVYYLEGGQVQSGYTDYYYENGKKWYVKEGIAYDYYNGEVSFTWPTPSSTIITSYFGKRDQPTAGASTEHKGIDIGAMHGSDIVAAASGTVVETGNNDTRGIYIIVSHGDGLKTLYQHCSALHASTGDTVEKGEKIASVGNTGVSTGAHLHFTVYLDGVAVNPLFYVSR